MCAFQKFDNHCPKGDWFDLLNSIQGKIVIQAELFLTAEKSVKESGLDDSYAFLPKQFPVRNNNNKDYVDIVQATLFFEEKDFQDVANFGKVQKSLCLVNKKTKLLGDEVKYNYMNFIKLLNHVGQVDSDVGPQSIQNQIFGINKRTKGLEALNPFVNKLNTA